MITTPTPLTITQPQQPNSRYRKIKPQPPHIPIPRIPPNKAHKKEHHTQLHKLEQEIKTHSKHQKQSDHIQIQRTTKKTHTAVYKDTDTTNQPKIINKIKFTQLYFRTNIPYNS